MVTVVHPDRVHDKVFRLGEVLFYTELIELLLYPEQMDNLLSSVCKVKVTYFSLLRVKQQSATWLLLSFQICFMTRPLDVAMCSSCCCVYLKLYPSPSYKLT